jgi:signal peptidase I
MVFIPMNPENKVNEILETDPKNKIAAQPAPIHDGHSLVQQDSPSDATITDENSIKNSLEEENAMVKKEPKGSGWQSMISTILLFLLAPIIALSITAFAFQSYQVDGESMETTLQNNDRLIVDKIPRTVSRITSHPYVPPRGDIIIFNQAGLFDSPTGEKQLIKRVIGLPGDRVFIKDGIITIYNRANPGGFNPDRSGLYTIAANNTSGDVNVTLQKNEIFVCGDNRSNSEDSRAFGPVNVNNIVGKLTLRILPISKAQSF